MGHDQAEDSAGQSNLEAPCRGLRQTTGHYGCPVMMTMTTTLEYSLPGAIVVIQYGVSSSFNAV